MPDPLPALTARVGVPLAELMDTQHPGEMELIYFNAGPLTLLFIAAEVCSSYLRRLGAQLPTGSIMSGCSEHVHIYLPDDGQIAEGGYEVDGFFDAFNINGVFRNRIEEQITSALHSLVGCCPATPETKRCGTPAANVSGEPVDLAWDPSHAR